MNTNTDSNPSHESRVFSVDFETYYDSEYSLTNMTMWAYCHDPRFDCYMVSIDEVYGDFTWVGHPSEFDWSMLNGATVLHHNAGFDGLVCKRLKEQGTIPQSIIFSAVHDTADLAAYCQLPRALKQIAKFVFGLDDLESAGAQARKKMQGLSGEALRSDKEILTYAANDALLTSRLWREYSEEWPEDERRLSTISREAGWYGIAIDTDYVKECCDKLQLVLFEAEQDIPWDWADKKTPLAVAKIRRHARDILVEIEEPLYDDEGKDTGRTQKVVMPLPLPSSFAKDSEECMEWEDQWADKFPWISAIRTWRRANILYQRFAHMRDYTFNGIYHHELKYFGAGRTGRFSGAGSQNIQNLPRGEMFGCDLRRCFIARPGHVLGVLDYAQIEPRTLQWKAGNFEFLEKVRAGQSTYQAHAEVTMGRTWQDLKKEDPDLYAQKKMEVLLLGYQGGAAKMAGASYAMTKDTEKPIELSQEEAEAIVADFRTKNPGLTNLWYSMDRALSSFIQMRKALMEIPLPSGRSLKFFRPTFKIDPKSGKKYRAAMGEYNVAASYRSLYGGKIVQNWNQAVCRDILANAILNVHDRGYRYLWSVHDEVIVELPIETAEKDLEEVERAMLDTPPWAKEIPFAVEKELTPHYKK